MAALPAWVGGVPGGGLLLLGAIVFHADMAWDRALTCTLFLAGALGLALVAAGGRYRRAPGRRPPQRPHPGPARGGRPGAVSRPAWWQRLLPLWRLILAGPVAGAAALAGAVLLAAHGPGDAADRLICAGLAAPLLWAAAGCWGLCAHHPGRAALGLSLLLGLLAAPLAWGMI